MDYIPPFGGDPEDVYVDRNTSTGTPGSKVPARIFNDLQAEFLNVLAAAEIEPNSEDLTQLAQAIQAMATGGDMFKAQNLSGLADVAAARANLGLFQEKGTDIAAAATTDLGAADSYYVRVTGNAAITSLGSSTDRKWVWVEFSSTPTLTHHATNLILPTGANISVQAGDTALFVKTGANSWHCLFYQRKNGASLKEIDYADLPAGSIIQVDYVENTAETTISAEIPLDDTVPTSTEGTQFLSRSFTPRLANSKILILTQAKFGGSSSNDDGAYTIFQGTTLLDAGFIKGEFAGDDENQFYSQVLVDAGSVAARTYAARLGRIGAASWVLNTMATGTAIFGNRSRASMTILEIKQ